MKSHALLLAVLAMFIVVCPSCARYSQGGPQRRPKKDEGGQPSDHDRSIIQMRVFQEVNDEMGADADEGERLKRVEELLQLRLREAFPDAYERKKKHADSDDIWENGTVVRYMARAIAVLLAFGGFFAFKDQILGRETFDGKKIMAPSDTRKNR